MVWVREKSREIGLSQGKVRENLTSASECPQMPLFSSIFFKIFIYCPVLCLQRSNCIARFETLVLFLFIEMSYFTNIIQCNFLLCWAKIGKSLRFFFCVNHCCRKGMKYSQIYRAKPQQPPSTLVQMMSEFGAITYANLSSKLFCGDNHIRSGKNSPGQGELRVQSKYQISISNINF